MRRLSAVAARADNGLPEVSLVLQHSGCTIRNAHHFRANYQVLKQLYDNDILAEDALLAWADEKAEASAEDRVFLQKVRMLRRREHKRLLLQQTLLWLSFQRCT